MLPKRQYLSLLLQKALSDLVAETRQGYIGVLWWIIEPILYMSVFYLIFAIIFDRGGKDAVTFLIVGLVVWKWFASTIPKCANSISANNGLIKQIYVPKVIFPGVAVVTTTMKFMVVFVLLLLFILIMGYDVAYSWLTLPILVSLQFLLMLSVGSFLAAVMPFLPDLKLIIDNMILMMFFLSGVFFDFSKVSPELKGYLELNPMLGLIENYRSVIVAGEWPDWDTLLYVFLLSVAFMLVAWYVMYRNDRIYPKIV